ncbi:transcriptional regulator, XRE family [Bacillus sp. JCM 19046]|nr:transcriptional regulator, XRE family [Bacillus sp. JCM 19046]
MKDEIAKRVQRLRKDAAMTQMELSRGICTQAQISNIEKGHLNPSSLTLFQISQKLNVDMNYFFVHSDAHQFTQLENRMNAIRACVHAGDYPEVRLRLRQEFNLDKVDLDQSRPFVLWHEGLSLFHLDKDIDQALNKLEEALERSKDEEKIAKEIELKIREDISALLLEVSKVEEAYSSYLHLNHLIDSRSNHQTNERMRIRTYLGLARCTYKMAHFHDAIIFSERGVAVSVGNQLIAHLGDLLETHGNSLIQLKKTDEGVNKLNKAKVLFELENKQKKLKVVKRY